MHFQRSLYRSTICSYSLALCEYLGLGTFSLFLYILFDFIVKHKIILIFIYFLQIFGRICSWWSDFTHETRQALGCCHVIIYTPVLPSRLHTSIFIIFTNYILWSTNTLPIGYCNILFIYVYVWTLVTAVYRLPIFVYIYMNIYDYCMLLIFMYIYEL